MKKEKIAIFLNSPSFNSNHSDLNLGFEYIVAVDGGIKHTLNRNFEIDLHLGDMDSSPKNIGKVKKREVFPVDKDFSDFYLALERVKRGSDIYIFGAIGGRVDHFLSNYDTAISFTNKFNFIKFCGNNEDMIFTSKSIDLNIDVGKTISIFSGSDKLTNLSLKGFKYEVEDVELLRSFPLGLSNVVKSESQEIKFESGVSVVVVNNRSV
ncbi:MAG: thiamine diphosphokinase [Candidatus Delongbacteria bacterium]|nr:MAG: thiamine diphosphokinase [Candidatus Delongbacteria bacterium]